MIEWSDVEELDAAFADVSDPLQTLFLGIVEETVDPEAYGGEDTNRTKMARMNLAAHLAEYFTSNGSGSAAGPVQSESGGGLSVTYAVAASAVTGDALAETAYGRAYEAGQWRSLGRGAWVL